MTVWDALALGLVQGLTEFLPVSSSGHLALAEAALGVNPGGVAFEVAVHLATALAVASYYGGAIARLARAALAGRRAAWAYLAKLAAASVPAAVAGLAAREAVARAFDAPALVALLLAGTGALLAWGRRYERPEPADAAAAGEPGGTGAAFDVPWHAALWMGAAQALALLPGISRSGTTIVAGLWRGLSPARAAEFSFLLALPAILGASALELPGLLAGGDGPDAGVGRAALAAGFGAAALSGFAALLWLVRWLERGRLHRFAYYCWAVAAATLLALGLA